MKTEALSKFLYVLKEHKHNPEAVSEIDNMCSILSTCSEISKGVVILCRSLSLSFLLPPDYPLVHHASIVCAEAMSWSPDKEQVFDAVDDWLECKSVSQVDSFLIQSSLLWACHDLKSAIRWAEEARELAVSLKQSSRKSWAEYFCTIIEYYRGIELDHQGEWKQAEVAFRHAIAFHPELIFLWDNLGWVLVCQGKLPEALSAYERAKKLNPEYWQAYLGIGYIYCKQRQFGKAESFFQRGLDIVPHNKALLTNLGVVQMAQGKLICAISSFRRATVLPSEPIEGGYDLSNEAREAYHPEEVIEVVFRRASTGPWNNLGIALKKIGRHEEAITAFCKEIEINPYYSLPWENLIYSYLQNHNLSEARNMLWKFLILQMQKAEVTPVRVARNFLSFTSNHLLARRELVAQADSANKLPGSGAHIIDNYLTIVRQTLIYGFRSKELETEDVIRSLVYIGMLWSLYAESFLQEKANKHFIREQLYVIEQHIVDSFTEEARVYGFNSIWPEVKARIGATSAEDFAKEMLRQEPAWLQSVSEGQKQGQIEDLRWRFQGNLWVHLYEYKQEQKIEHLERTHYYMELLKGHTVLRKLVNPKIMGRSINARKWNRYVDSLPVKVDRTAVVDLKACAASLPQNGIGLSFYFLHRPLLPDLLLVIVLKPGQVPYLKIAKSTKRLEEFQNAAKRLKQVHHQVAWQWKVSKTGRKFCELSGEKKELEGRELVKAITKWEKKQLRQAYKAILEKVIDVEELRGKDLYVSPSPEMYDIPFGLLLKDDEFLNEIVNSITVVPIFSLRQFQRKGYFPDKDGFVLCLDKKWKDDAQKRAESLSGSWCSKVPYQKIEHDLSASTFKGDIDVKYNEWIEAIAKRSKVHIIGHHDALQWARSTENRPNLGQFGRYLYEAPEKLSTNVLSLEACWGGTWSEPEDLMGLFVSFLASGVSHVLASPYSVVPAATSGKLFDRIYGHSLGTENGNTGLQIARALREAAEAVRLASLNFDDIIPSLWGALQVYSVT